jgi:hypothetical protein
MNETKYSGLCCSINGVILFKLINENSNNVKTAYVKISYDEGLNFGSEILVSNNFLASSISCSSNGKIIIVGGQKTDTFMAAIYASVNYGYTFQKMIINSEDSYDTIIDCNINELTYGLNTYICFGAISDKRKIFYSSIKNIDCNNNVIDTERLTLKSVKNLDSLQGLTMSNSKISITSDSTNGIFRIHVSTYFNDGGSVSVYIVSINSFDIFIDGTINTPIQRSYNEFKPIPSSYDMSTIFKENYNTGFCFINNTPCLTFNVYIINADKMYEAGYFYYYDGNAWISAFYDPSQTITQTSIVGKGISALTTSNNNLMTCILINSSLSDEYNTILMSNNLFSSYNTTQIETKNYCKNLCMTTNTFKLIKAYILSPLDELFICSTNNAQNINTLTVNNEIPFFVDINITQKQLYYFSNKLKTIPNIFFVKLLINIYNKNKLEFDIFTDKCFTLQTKKNMMTTYELFKLFYSNNKNLYYKTLINIINCIKFNTLNRNVSQKIKKYLKCLFYNIIKYINKHKN